MRCHVRFRGGTRFDPGSRAWEEILASALDRFQRLLGRVHVYVEDVNGPRGGVDKHCLCVPRPRRMPAVVLRDQDENLAALLHRVARRASHALRKMAGQKTDRRRRGARRGFSWLHGAVGEPTRSRDRGFDTLVD